MDEHKQIPIWFFIGVMLLFYGVLIAFAGVFDWLAPPPVDERVKLWHLHADVWWGAVMAVIGLAYTLRFRPRREPTA